jgi:hypothetical protein
MNRLFIFEILLILLIACTTSERTIMKSEFYEVLDFQDKTLKGYNVILLKDRFDKKFILLSEQFGRSVDKPPFENYKVIQEGDEYQLALIPQDSIYIVNLAGYAPFIHPYTFYLDSILLIQNDTIKSQIYRSKNVFDKFVQLGK